MSDFLKQCRAARALVVVLAVASSARADLLTPDSIPSPPPLSPASEGSAVAPGAWVTDQYVRKGLLFPYQMTGVDTGLSAALVRVNGVKVWTGADSVDGGFLGGVSFRTALKAELVVAGTQTAAVTDNLRLRLVAAGGTGLASALIETWDARGNPLLVQRTSLSESPAGTWVTLAGPGLHSFQVSAFPGLIPADSSGTTPFSWGIAAVDFQETPEPASWVLASLGLIGWVWRRRPFASVS